MKYLTIALLFVFSASASLKVGTYNIRNFDRSGSSTNKPLLTDIILKMDVDLLAVQEIFNASSFSQFVKDELPGHKIVLSKCGGGGSQKLGFIYKEKELKLLNSYEDDRLEQALSDRCGSLRPAMVGVFQDLDNNQKFAAISVHLKAGSGDGNYSRRAKQYKKVQVLIEELKRKGYAKVLAMGDFNTTGYEAMDADYRNFKKLLNQTSSSTSARHAMCTSYWSGRDYNDGIEVASTLDHIVYTSAFDDSSAKVLVGSHCQAAGCEDVYEGQLGESYQTVSDHCPVSIVLK